MTPRRAEVLRFVQSYLVERGASPGISEIAAALGIHKTTALRHLQQLEREGLIRRPEGMRRSIAIVRPESDHGVEPELVQAIFGACAEVEAGIAYLDLPRARNAAVVLRGVADSWMRGTLRPQPYVEEGCTDVAVGPPDAPPPQPPIVV